MTEAFGFLLARGFALAELSDTVARYESSRRLVQVFHGRASYELGVDLGRWIEVDGVRCEQVFPLRDVIALRRAPAEAGLGGTTATTSGAVRRFLGLLGSLTREFAEPMLIEGDEWFELLSELNADRSSSGQQTLRASRLRERADSAWRRGDFGAVVIAYSEIEGELRSVTLRPSERGRLEYARRAVDGPPGT
ncbi:hypothetical protein, partial [Cellulomonas composti]|uniref:hypothetical protein n=1 Tax=Cellulomonas composti TaxID=266130 RepID=UPI0011BF173C